MEACGGSRRAADVARVGKASLFRYTDDSDDNATRHMPIDVVRALEQMCGRPVVTRFLAAETGYVMTQVPEGGQLRLDWSLRLADLAKENSDVFAKFGEILADGKISRLEAGQAIQEVDEAMALMGAIRQVLRDIADGEGESQ